MTEAVGGIIKWANVQPRVSAIIASTHKDNIASFSILQKNNISKIDEAESLLK